MSEEVNGAMRKKKKKAQVSFLLIVLRKPPQFVCSSLLFGFHEEISKYCVRQRETVCMSASVSEVGCAFEYSFLRPTLKAVYNKHQPKKRRAVSEVLFSSAIGSH